MAGERGERPTDKDRYRYRQRQINTKTDTDKDRYRQKKIIQGHIKWNVYENECFITAIYRFPEFAFVL